MKQLLKLGAAALALGLMTTSCKTYVRLVETQSSGTTKNAEQAVVFENDTMRVTYDLWAEKGIMYFTVYNKLNMPLYVDWKKGSYIEEGINYVYWRDRETTETYYTPTTVGNKTVMVPKNTTIKEERITFIPPHTYAKNPITYNIMSDASRSTSRKVGKKILIENVDLRNDKTATHEAVSKSYAKSGKTKVHSKTYTKENSPLVFRNYITVSTFEDFRRESHLQTEFYVNKMTEMTSKQFNGKGTPGRIVVKRGKSTRSVKTTVYEYPYRSNASFYHSLLY